MNDQTRLSRIQRDRHEAEIIVQRIEQNLLLRKLATRPAPIPTPPIQAFPEYPGPEVLTQGAM